MNGGWRHLAVMTDYIMCNHAKALCAAVTLISGHHRYHHCHHQHKSWTNDDNGERGCETQDMSMVITEKHAKI